MDHKTSEHQKTNADIINKHLGTIVQILFRHKLTCGELHAGTRNRLIEAAIYVEKNKSHLPVCKKDEIDHIMEQTRHILTTNAKKVIRQREQDVRLQEA